MPLIENIWALDAGLQSSGVFTKVASRGVTDKNGCVRAYLSSDGCFEDPDSRNGLFRLRSDFEAGR